MTKVAKAKVRKAKVPKGHTLENCWLCEDKAEPDPNCHWCEGEGKVLEPKECPECAEIERHGCENSPCFTCGRGMG